MTQQVVALPSEIEQTAEAIRSTIVGHTKFVHGYTMPEHQLGWAEALQDFSIKRLLIIAPPKYGKSPTVGLDYLGWRIGNDHENYHCIYLSNTAAQASKYSVALRDTIDFNAGYRWLYQGVKPDKNKGWAEDEWFVKRTDEADKDPTLQAFGVDSMRVGPTVQEVVFDDIADEDNMNTAYQREKLMKRVRSMAMSRLVPVIGRCVMICTRWHEEDPAAEFANEGWYVVEMPAINEKGESTYPGYWTLDALEERHVDLGTYQFELTFQNNVLPAGGSIFKHEWWRYWENGTAPWQLVGELKQPIIATVQTWDTAHKGKEKNDYSACETWAIVKGGYYLLNAWRAKLDYPKLKVAFKQMNQQFSPRYILIEDAASGQDLILEMRQDTALPIVAIQVSHDKVARANAVTPVIETGNVYLPKDAGWLHEWEYEHEIFPGGKNDDWVDCTTQFLNWARTHVTTGPSAPVGIPKTSTWRTGRL